MKLTFFNRQLKILLVTNSIILLAAAMLGPIYALFVEEIGGSLLDASFAGAVFALAAGITVVISGYYADKIQENRYIVVIGYLLMGIGFYLYYFVSTIWFLLIVQCIIGIGEAIYSPAFDAIYSKHICNKHSGKQWGAWESMNYFMAAFGAFIGGLIANKYGFHTLFIIMGTLCMLSSVYILRLRKGIL